MQKPIPLVHSQPTKKHTMWFALVLSALVILGVLIVVAVRLIVDHDELSVVLPSITPNPTQRVVPSPQTVSPSVAQPTGIMCGGIEGKICPAGYTCHGVAKYPDAAGTCLRDALSPTPEVGNQTNIDFAKDDLVARLGIERDQITVVYVRDVTWNDGSLGCPQPGRMYTQSIVEGYEIALSYQSKQYSYHGGKAKPFYCVPNK